MDTAIYKANEKMEFLANDKEVLRLYHLLEIWHRLTSTAE